MPKAEKLAQNSNWHETTKKMITLQKKWKKSGHVFGKKIMIYGQDLKNLVIIFLKQKESINHY